MVDILGHKKRVIQEKAVITLIRSLKDSDIAVRQAAAKAISKIGDARAIVPLADMMCDSDRRAKCRGAIALRHGR